MLDRRVDVEESAGGADGLGGELRARLAPFRMAHLTTDSTALVPSADAAWKI